MWAVFKKYLISIFLASLFLGCKKDPINWYKNDFVAFPIQESISIKSINLPFSKECIFVFDTDSIVDFTVCRFSRSDEDDLKRFFKVQNEYVPNGFMVTEEKVISNFGNYVSDGRLRVMVDSTQEKGFAVATHRVEVGSYLIGVVSRIKKAFPSDEWFENNKKWRYSWKLF